MADALKEANIVEKHLIDVYDVSLDYSFTKKFEHLLKVNDIDCINKEYTEQYHEYFSEFITECFDSSYVEELVRSTAEMISPYVEKDPTKFCTYDEYETGVETLLEFLELRASSVSGQLSGTIPSTSEGQQEDSSALVDASDINISDMGSMGNMGDGNAPDMQNMPDGGMPDGNRPGAMDYICP